MGPGGSQEGTSGSRMVPYMGLYISRTPIRDSRVIGWCSSGPVGSYRVPTGFSRNPDLGRRTPTRLDGSLDCPVSVHDSCADPYGPLRRPHGPSGPCRDPTGPRRTPGGTVGPRFIGASPVWAARHSYWRQPWLWYIVFASDKVRGVMLLLWKVGIAPNPFCRPRCWRS